MLSSFVFKKQKRIQIHMSPVQGWFHVQLWNQYYVDAVFA